MNVDMGATFVMMVHIAGNFVRPIQMMVQRRNLVRRVIAHLTVFGAMAGIFVKMNGLFMRIDHRVNERMIKLHSMQVLEVFDLMPGVVVHVVAQMDVDVPGDAMQVVAGLCVIVCQAFAERPQIMADAILGRVMAQLDFLQIDLVGSPHEFRRLGSASVLNSNEWNSQRDSGDGG
jgi:hypothetical protein